MELFNSCQFVKILEVQNDNVDLYPMGEKYDFTT